MNRLLQSGLPEDVAPAELLAKFIVSSSHFSRIHQRVKPAAFIPPSGKGSSVFRISELALGEVRSIGQAVAAQRQPPRTLYGHGRLQAEAVAAAGLKVMAEEPPPRHADILGWLKTRISNWSSLRALQGFQISFSTAEDE